MQSADNPPFVFFSVFVNSDTIARLIHQQTTLQFSLPQSQTGSLVGGMDLSSHLIGGEITPLKKILLLLTKHG